jgi:spermidine synthase
MKEGSWEWKKFLGKYYLKYNGKVFSIINTKKIFTNSYWDIFLPFISIYKEGRVLIIGLGGGTTIFQARALFKNVNIEAVDINKKSIEMSSRFIDVKNEKIYIMDGNDFVKNCKNRYDVIILDAYDDYFIPDQFLTDDFIFQVKRILNDNGLFLINYALTIVGRTKLKNFLKILRKYFKVYGIGPTALENNMVIIASNKYSSEEIINKMESIDMFPKKLLFKIKKMRENI